MTYTPDPSDITQPVNTQLEGTAAAEFIAIKNYLKNVFSNQSRNILINGSMRLDQLNYGLTTYVVPPATTAFHLIDMWSAANPNTAGNITAQQLSGGPNVNGKCLSLIYDSTATQGQLWQSVESIYTQLCASGRNITVSGYIYVDNNTGVVITPTLETASAQDNFASVSTVGTGTAIVTANGVFTYFKQTIQLTGNAFTGLRLKINMTGTSGRTLKFTNMQMELNDFATPFNYQDDLYLAQRYYYVCAIQYQGYNITGGANEQVINLPRAMRLYMPTVAKSFDTYANCSFGAVAVTVIGNNPIVQFETNTTATGVLSYTAVLTVDARMI